MSCRRASIQNGWRWISFKVFTYSVGTHAEFTHRFCKKYDLKLVFAGSSFKNSNTYDLNYNFYKEYLSDYNFQYLPVDPYKFSNSQTHLKQGCYWMLIYTFT